MRKPDAVCPEEVRDECLLPPRGETCYWLCLADEHVELLARGECPESVARQAFSMLSWKRLHARKQDQDTHTFLREQSPDG